MFGDLDTSFPLHACSLTGLALNGRASFQPDGMPPNVLYTFEPIGSALMDLGLYFSLSASEQRGQLQPRPDLAGACREAKERGLGPYDITERFIKGPDSSWPRTFDEKLLHFLRLFYESGGRERKKRTINVLEDFPMAFAQDAEEFHRILEALLDEALLRYDKSSRVQGDWVNGIQAWYHNVLLTPQGKSTVLASISPPSDIPQMASNSFHFGSNANVNLVQGDGATQTNISGNNASVNVARGNNNTQTNQNGQPSTLAELTEALKQALSLASFDSRRDEIAHELEVIESQLDKPTPKKSILERSFDYVKELAIKSAGPAAAATVVELIKHAPELLAAAHLG